MKKQLLLSSALLLALGTNAQTAKMKAKATGVINMAEKLAQKYAAVNNPMESPANPTSQGSTNEEETTYQSKTSAIASPTVQWRTIGGSQNINGMIVSSSKPLQYNDELNAVSFVHRSGSSYVASPVNNSGAIVARISSNWGATWDSTCIWSDGTNLARYPQGGLYNPSINNNNISNAYVVGMGPVTDPSTPGWKGNWYASKSLSTFNSTASAVPGAQQYFPNTPPYVNGVTKHDFSRYSFSATDDGKIRSIAGRYDGKDGQNQPTGFRGAAIVKGSFNAGIFNWTTDTIIPNVIIQTDGNRSVFSQPYMAWSESGEVGYVVFIGAASTATGSNKGWQPIVYRTSNFGASWSSISGIDFNSVAFQPIKQVIRSIGTGTLEVPFFKIDEGVDLTVDANNRLHIMSTVVGTASHHNDSLAFTWQVGAQKYSYGHVPGDRPYLYDFIGDGTSPWTFVTIDSLSSEGPGATQTSPGYTSNPWPGDPAQSLQKVVSDSRFQMSRTPDGQYIVYSWAESDTAFTNDGVKWNEFPNLKARCLLTTQGTTVTTLSPTEINLTRPTVAQTVSPTYTLNNQISNRAMFHYMSNECQFTGCVGSNTVQIRVPFTISNSNPLSATTENRNWFSASILDFGGLTNCTGFQQSLAYNVNNLDIFPNPAHSNATVKIDLKEQSPVTLNVYNMIGQLMQSSKINGQVGDNKIDVDLSNLTTGIYLVKVQVGNTTSTKKLIVQ